LPNYLFVSLELVSVMASQPQALLALLHKSIGIPTAVNDDAVGQHVQERALCSSPAALRSQQAQMKKTADPEVAGEVRVRKQGVEHRVAIPNLVPGTITFQSHKLADY
jgi:hypothetical protein